MYMEIVVLTGSELVGNQLSIIEAVADHVSDAVV
jgi:hypothetical protein